ncbi:MAG: hypothetical protein ACRD3E_07205 [Terriglobales bacterium]
MKRFALVLVLVLAVTLPSFCVPLATSARAAIPFDVQQIICVDYRALKDSPTALALKARVLPDNIKEFEESLRSTGIYPDKDVDQLSFTSFRANKKLHIIGIAQGQFSTKAVLAKLKKSKAKAEKYRLSDIYPMSGGQSMVFLDDFTLLFGQKDAVKAALDARDGEAQSLASNSTITDQIGSVQDGAVWSVLDQSGTENMLQSTLGDAAKLADYDVIKKRLVASRYTMDFNNGVKFNLNVVTSDSMTAATLASLLKAGVLFRKMGATGSEKLALDSVTVDNSSSNLTLLFKTDDKQFQSLLSSPLFAAVSK